MNPKKILIGLLHSKFGKLLPVLLIAGLTATASASVFVMYYGSATATVKTPDISLVAGTDISGSCSSYPCATASIASTKDFETVGLSFFPSVTNTPQPATYFTNLTTIQNGGSVSHTINSVTISNIGGTTADLGSITIYYCSTQTNTPATSSSCDSFAITSTTGGSLSGHSILPATLTAGSKGYLEAVAYAASGATAGQSVTFQIAISWV
jgi:hypothetical protein